LQVSLLFNVLNKCNYYNLLVRLRDRSTCKRCVN